MKGRGGSSNCTHSLAQSHPHHTFNYHIVWEWGFPGKESACSAGDAGLIPGPGRPPGEGNSYPLQYSCLENSTDRGA